MTQVINDLRSEVNRFQEENEKLEAEINVMDEELVKWVFEAFRWFLFREYLSNLNIRHLFAFLLFRLKEQESRLNDITEKQGTNVDSFVKLVKENKELVKKQKVRSCSPNYRDAEIAMIVPPLKLFPLIRISAAHCASRNRTASILCDH